MTKLIFTVKVMYDNDEDDINEIVVVDEIDYDEKPDEYKIVSKITSKLRKMIREVI